MFRKIISIALAVFCIFLAGCSNGNSEIYNQKMMDMHREQKDKDASPVEPRGSLTVSTYFDGYMTERAKSFMEIYPDVDIQVVSPQSVSGAEEETLEMYGKRIAVELMSGTAGDLVDLSHLSAYKYARSGLLCDLNSFMKNDPSFNEEDYYANIFKAMEFNGELYALPFAFNYDVMYINRPVSENLGIKRDKYGGLNYQQMLDIYERVKADKSVSPSFGIMPGIVKDSFFKYEFTDFYNVEKGQAWFDSEVFLNYLRTTNTMNVPDGSWDMNYISSGNDEYMKSQYMFSKFRLNAVDAHNFLIDYKNVWGPVPLTSSGGDFLFDTFLATYGISQNSQNKELAWEFLKYCIEEKEPPSSADEKASLDYFYMYEGWMPINIQNFYSLYRTYCQSDLKRFADSPILWKEGDKEKLLEEALNQIHEWNLQRNKPASEFELWSLVQGDLENYYYYGLATAEETGAIIQDKVTAYLNE